LLDEELSLVDFLLDQILLLKEIVVQQGGVVPSIVTELLCHKQVALPLDVAISDHQQSLKYSDYIVGNSTTGVGCKSVLYFARCRARCAHLRPFLHRGRMRIRRCTLRGCGDGKAKPPWVPRLVVHNV
jgi:hypothetical protein